jgi:hypothetical protein
MKPLLPLIVLLMALLLPTAKAEAQLAFRILDTRTGDVRPRISDIPGSEGYSIEVGGMTLAATTIDRELRISLDTGYFPGGSPVFQTATGYRRGFLSVERGIEKMHIELRNVAPGVRYLLGAIPFRAGRWVLDLEPARKNERHFYELDSLEKHLVREPAPDE